jgi:hypothetical protein
MVECQAALQAPKSILTIPGGYGLGHKMIRTVWLAVICLTLVSALAVGKAVRAPADPKGPELSADETTVVVGHAQDTLSKADRLEINHVRHEIPPQPVLQSIEPAVPVVTPPRPPMETKIISRHWHDPNAFSSSLKNSKQIETNNKSKNVDRKRSQAADRSKPAEPVKPCSRPVPLGDLLRSVKLSPGCTS